MNATQKRAVLNLAVAAVALAAVAILIPWLGDRAAGAFGLLGLVGLTPWLFRPRDGGIEIDERDASFPSRWFGLSHSLV